MSEASISRALAAGRLHRIHPRVYAVGHRALPIQGRLTAALLYARPGAALSHTTAGWWWGLLHERPRVIHVASQLHHRSLPEVKVHRPRNLKRVVHRGLPVTLVARTLLDLASTLPAHSLRRALAEAEFLRLFDWAEAEAALARGQPGSAALREAIRRHRPELARTRSVLEERFLTLCETFEIPMPAVNARVCGFFVDALWRDAGLVVELDGRVAHELPARISADRHRELTLRRAGYRVIRYSWEQVTRQPDRVAEDLSDALGR